MEIITLTIHSEDAKQEILDFLEKFNPKDAELQFESNQKVQKHHFFGMTINNKESVNETINHLRNVRYR